MRKIPDDELRVQLKRGLQQLPRSVVKGLGGSDAQRQQALETGADILMGRFDRNEV